MGRSEAEHSHRSKGEGKWNKVFVEEKLERRVTFEM